MSPISHAVGRSLEKCRDQHKTSLLEDTVPFWEAVAPDRVHGGFFFGVSRQGKIIDTDKAVWLQGRFAWLLSTLYLEVEPRPEWLALARDGIDFLLKNGFDQDGRMYFLLTREGAPLRKRRYFFSEVFLFMALAAYADAAKSEEMARLAKGLFQKIVSYASGEAPLPPKVIPPERRFKNLAVPMVVLHSAQLLRGHLKDSSAEFWIHWAIRELKDCFVRPELEAVLENVSPDGTPLLGHFEGRHLNPGHAIESAWFVLHEGVLTNNAEHRKLGLKMLDWSWQRGWDSEYGGLFYFRDVLGYTSPDLSHDQKLWWPHNEAVLATLLAWQLTGDEKYLHWHDSVHAWMYSRFPDPEFGEWFGYLHRDGRLSLDLKGNHWKGGAFHIARMQLRAWKWIDRLLIGDISNPARGHSAF
jgi:N-acylglucosamine 2-epimerase